MRFQVFLRLFDGGCSDEHRLWAIDESTRLMESFDKARPDYQDPAKLEETLLTRVGEAIERDRVIMRQRLAAFLQRGIGGGSSELDYLTRSQQVRWSAEDSRRLANEVIPCPEEARRG